MTSSTRRSFLKAATATAAAVSVANKIPAWAQTVNTQGSVQVWSTWRDGQHAVAQSLAWAPATKVYSNAISLDPTETRQEILGFGGALTDASCYMLSQLRDDERAALMRELFAEDDMALNVCRVCVGSSDYARSIYNYDDSEQDDPELTKFSIDHDKAYILPILREARKLNPDLFLFSSPWSPPGWMKFNRSMLGGTIRKSALEPYSRYMLKFLEAYKAEGAPIDALTVQNEVDTTVDGRYPACQWSQEDEILFVGKYLGPLLRKANNPTKIWILDHNFNLWGRAIAELSDPTAAEFIDGVAWHGYAGDPAGITQVHKAFPRKDSFFTEGGPQRPSMQPGAPFVYDLPAETARWVEWANSVFRNWSRSITVWNMALDENANPYIGHLEPEAAALDPKITAKLRAGAVTIENSTHKVTRNPKFWGLSHYSKHVRRGAKVFLTETMGEVTLGSACETVSHAGFRNPDGSLVVVLSNRGADTKAQLLLGSNALELELPGNSVHTLQWS